MTRREAPNLTETARRSNFLKVKLCINFCIAALIIYLKLTVFKSFRYLTTHCSKAMSFFAGGSRPMGAREAAQQKQRDVEYNKQSLEKFASQLTSIGALNDR